MGRRNLEIEKRVGRLEVEADVIGQIYGDVSFDDEDGTWLLVRNFTLPRGWNKESVEILIDIPHGTPGYPSVAPHWFWVDHDLKTVRGGSIHHFFEHDNDDYLGKGWGHFCVHLEEWKPLVGAQFYKGHSLVNYLNLIHAIFDNRRRLAK